MFWNSNLSLGPQNDFFFTVVSAACIWFIWFLSAMTLRCTRSHSYDHKRGLTWQACARLMPTLKRADMPGGREVGSVLPRPGLMTWMHFTTASTISSLLNSFTLSTSSFTSLRVTNSIIGMIYCFKKNSNDTKWYNSPESSDETCVNDHMMAWLAAGRSRDLGKLSHRFRIHCAVVGRFF